MSAWCFITLSVPFICCSVKDDGSSSSSASAGYTLLKLNYTSHKSTCTRVNGGSCMGGKEWPSYLLLCMCGEFEAPLNIIVITIIVTIWKCRSLFFLESDATMRDIYSSHARVLRSGRQYKVGAVKGFQKYVALKWMRQLVFVAKLPCRKSPGASYSFNLTLSLVHNDWIQ